MSTVYAVEHGDYSDHMIHALFTSEALANEYADAIARSAGRYWSDVPAYNEAAEIAAARSEISVVAYQLWDAVPVVTDREALYEHDHREPVS